MAPQITVHAAQMGTGWECNVTISEGGAATHHLVSVDEADRARFGGADITVERLVRESFAFLLEREPKESILHSFALPVIARYFPEYEREIKKRLRR